MKINSLYKRYFFYLIRWQLSTPILAPVMILLASQGMWISAVVGNFIGGILFFWLDRSIFRSKYRVLWEIVEEINCTDCGTKARGYRLVQSTNYSAEEKKPEFRCEKCSILKTEELKKRGINT